MNFSKLTVNDQEIKAWMKFPLQLGQVLKRYSNKNKKAFNIYISVPNSLMFSYFLFQGMFDVEGQRRIRDQKMIERFLQLSPGEIVYYNDNGTWCRCSVISIEENFTTDQKYHLQIQSYKDVKLYIPVCNWIDQLIITDIQHDKILNPRVVKDFQKSSVTLSALYSAKTIEALEVLNTPTAYFSGNRAEFERYMQMVSMKYNGVTFTHKDIIHFGMKRHFKNARWLTVKDENLQLANDEWLISIGANKAINNLDAYTNCGHILLEDQFENASTSEMLQEFVTNDMILHNATVMTEQLITLLGEAAVEIPNGVSVIAWK